MWTNPTRAAYAYQEDLQPLVEARLKATTDRPLRARAILATAFACLDAATMTWVEQNGEGDIPSLYDACLSAART